MRPVIAIGEVQGGQIGRVGSTPAMSRHVGPRHCLSTASLSCEGFVLRRVDETSAVVHEHG